VVLTNGLLGSLLSRGRTGKRCNIQFSAQAPPWTFPGRPAMDLPAALTLISSFARPARAALVAYPVGRAHATVLLGLAVTWLYRGSRQDIYNILWAVVFGFATLNILSLAARRFDAARRGLTFGELMAVMVVLLSVFLLGWEMLNLFHIFPIKLKP